MRAWRLDTHSTAPYVVFGFVIVLILALAWMWDSAAQQRAARNAPTSPDDFADAEEPGEAAASAFPVPPLDLPHYHGLDLDAGVGIEADVTHPDTSTKEVTGA